METLKRSSPLYQIITVSVKKLSSHYNSFIDGKLSLLLMLPSEWMAIYITFTQLAMILTMSYCIKLTINSECVMVKSVISRQNYLTNPFLEDSAFLCNEIWKYITKKKNSCQYEWWTVLIAFKSHLYLYQFAICSQNSNIHL